MHLFLALLTGLGFGGWVLYYQYFKLNSAWSAVLVSVVGTLALIAWHARSLDGLPDRVEMGHALAAGLLNGMGMIAYIAGIAYMAKSGRNTPALGIAIMIALLALGGPWIAGVPIPLAKRVGIALLAAGAYLAT